MRFLSLSFITLLILVSCNNHDETKVKDVKLVEVNDSILPPPPPPPPPRPPVDLVVTTGKLAMDFKQNRKAALAKYTGKFIEIPGIVAGVRDNHSNTVVVLKDRGNALTVECTIQFSRTAKDIAIGTPIKVYALCEGWNEKILLKSMDVDIEIAK